MVTPRTLILKRENYYFSDLDGIRGTQFRQEKYLANLLPTLERFPVFVIAIRVLEISFELTIAARDEKWSERVRRRGAQK